MIRREPRDAPSQPGTTTALFAWLVFATMVSLVVAACGAEEPGAAACADDCLFPPAAVCEGATRVSFTPPGDCMNGQCEFFRVERACAGGCESGECLPEPCEGEGCELCEGIVCDSPPAPRCEGRVAVRPRAAGECTAGQCTYGETRTTCSVNEVCDDGLCQRSELCVTQNCGRVPDDVCEGTTAIVYGEEGTCTVDGCVFSSERIPCAATGQRCVRGACVGDPCATVTCDEPPDDFCREAVAVQYFGAGTCEGDGSCTYESVEDDCGARDLRCVAGLCVPGDPCEDVTCDAPPAGTCVGSVASRPSSGTCVRGTCQWAQETIDCALTDELCLLGQCVPVDACTSISCEPPAPSCDGSVAVVPVRSRCQNGVCVDEVRREACGERGLACRDGICVVGDPCEGVTCTEPPEAQCSGDFRIPWLPGEGVCSEGTCRFQAGTPVDCSAQGETCRRGECVDPASCEGPCDDPPDPYCSGGAAIVSQLPGTCTDGVCVYGIVEDACGARGLACVGGACDDPCSGVTCDASAAPLCEGTVSVVRTNGRCIGGACEFDEARTDCLTTGQSCFGGICVDDCGGACATPPAAFCSGTSAISYVAPGTCQPGGCAYEPSTRNCASEGLGCREGACVELCEDVLCATPPPSTCLAGGVARTWAAGDCIDGECTWEPVLTECGPSQSCTGGRCVDACTTLDCSTPPGATCRFDFRVSFAPAGCDSGACQWAEQITNCRADGRVCEDGRCVDPCVGVVCEDGPARCEGNEVVQQVSIGCSFGECARVDAVRACRDEGAYCENGACVPGDPCTGVSCLLPPQCQGDILVTWPNVTPCADGVCLFRVDEEVRVDCFASTGGACVAGACAPAPTPLPGQLLVTELAPLGNNVGVLAPVAWFEVGNRTDRRLSLEGVTIEDANGTLIPLATMSAASIGPREHLVVVVPTGPFAPSLLSGTRLAGARVLDAGALSIGAEGRLRIRSAGTTLADVAWDVSWGFELGRSMQLDAEGREDQSGIREGWCGSWADVDTEGNLGSPFDAGAACGFTDAFNATPGLLRVSEVMPIGRADRAQTSWWIEVLNLDNRPLLVDGLVIELGTTAVTVASEAFVGPGRAIVVAGPDASGLPAEGVVRTGDAATLAVGTGTVRIRQGGSGGDLLDSLEWGGGAGATTVAGTAWQRDGVHPIERACRSAAPMPNGHFGTPGAANRSCLGPATCASSAACTAFSDQCDRVQILRVGGAGECTPRGCDYNQVLSLLDCPQDGQVCLQNGVCGPPPEP